MKTKSLTPQMSTRGAINASRFLKSAIFLIAFFILARPNLLADEPLKPPYDKTVEGILYHIENGEATVTGVENYKLTEAVIAETVDDIPVTTIGEGAFVNCPHLNGLVIPDSVKTIASEGLANGWMSHQDGEWAGYATSFCLMKYIIVGDGVEEIDYVALGYIPDEYKFFVQTVVQTDNEYVTEWFEDNFPQATIISMDDPRPYRKTVNGIIYRIMQGAASVEGVEDEELTEATILSEVDGYPVTAIEDGAFQNLPLLTAVSIPASYGGELDEWAFDGSDSLSAVNVASGNEYYASQDGVLYTADFTKLLFYPQGKPDISFTIPDGVINVAEYAFEYATALEEIVIARSVTAIDTNAFNHCVNLATVYIYDVYSFYWFEENLPQAKVVILADDDDDDDAPLPEAAAIVSGKGEITLWTDGDADWFIQTATFNTSPSAMQSGEIGDDGVSTMTAKVTGAGVLSFYWKVSSEDGCDFLSFSVDGVQKSSISGETGWQQMGCTLEAGEHEVSWSYSKDSFISDGQDCGWVDDIVWPDNDYEPPTVIPVAYDIDYDYEEAIVIGLADEFNYDTTLVIPEFIEGYPVTYILDGAFSSCWRLTSVTLPDTLEAIGASAFMECSNLKSIIIPDGVSYVGNGAFCYCSSLETVTLPETLEFIDTRVFIGCNSLKTIVIPGGVLTIDDYAFATARRESKTSLYGITIGNGVEYIADYAFGDCEPEYNFSDLCYVQTDNEYVKEWFAERYPQVNVIGMDDELPPIPYRTTVDGIVYLVKPTLGTVMVEGFAKDEDGDSLEQAAVTIPAAVEGYPVTAIDDSAFEGCENLQSVVLPSSLVELGEDCFSYCGLRSIVLPEGLTTIGDYAFEYCEELAGIVIIPASVTTIGTDVFDGCVCLQSIEVAAGNTEYFSQDGVLYTADWTELVCYPYGRSAPSFILPASVTSVPSFDAPALQEILVEEGNTAFVSRDGALYMYGNDEDWWLIRLPAGSQTTVYTLPANTTNIDYYAFYDCYALQGVVIGEQLECVFGYRDYDDYFRAGTLFGGTNLTYVQTDNEQFAEWVRNWNPNISVIGMDEEPLEVARFVTTGDGVVYRMKYDEAELVKLTDMTITELVIPSEVDGCPVTAIAPDAFRGTDTLLSVVLSEGVASIGQGAFADCANLVTVELPDTLAEIEANAFADCTALTAISLPESLVSLHDGAFAGCTALTFISIPDSVTVLGDNGTRAEGDGVFEGCENLAAIVIGQGVTTIADNAFEGCTALATIYTDNEALLPRLRELLGDQVNILPVPTPFRVALQTSYTFATRALEPKDELIFGLEAAAVREVAIPGSPAYTLAFVDGEKALATDIRTFAESATWTVQVTLSAESSLTLDWAKSASGEDDTYAMPEEYAFTLKSGNESLNMRETTSIVLDNTGLDQATYTLVIKVARKAGILRTLVCELLPGWNLVGIPFELTEASKTALAGYHAMGYDAASQCYITSALAYAPGSAVWLFSNASATLPLQGTPVENERITLRKGWNLVSPLYGEDGAAVPNPGLDNAWYWTAEGNRRLPPTEYAFPGTGYWIFADASTTIW